jgi:two-component system chemotaxis response regulator CheB
VTPVCVLVVDDSTVVRRLVTTALEEDSRIRVVGTAANGRLALAKIDQLRPDVVTLDLEMPVMDGIEVLKVLRKTHPDLPVVVFSTLTERGGAKTLDALSAGAADYVTKPTSVRNLDDAVRAVREQLAPKVVTLHEAAVARAGLRRPTGRPAEPAAGPPRRRAPAGGRVEVVALGCSTGGPEALAAIVPRLPGDLAVPILVVQHMPRLFTRLLAQRLDRLGGLRVIEAAGDEPLEPGHVYIAPGERHLEVVRDAAGVPRTRLSSAPPENNCRPAVDVLFRSVAQEYGGAALGVVLTGMGSDGRRGSEALVGTGSRVIVQDEASSVVWGMPRAVADAGLADEVLPLDAVAAAVLDRTSRTFAGTRR